MWRRSRRSFCFDWGSGRQAKVLDLKPYFNSALEKGS
jgi:hypothetical protein